MTKVWRTAPALLALLLVAALGLAGCGGRGGPSASQGPTLAPPPGAGGGAGVGGGGAGGAGGGAPMRAVRSVTVSWRRPMAQTA
ncbi:hypothetical protein MXD61_04165, partial [Frankia sp. AgPm24]